MTKREIQEEFTLRLLRVVDQCDKDLQAAYDKRRKTLIELNEWLSKTYKEGAK
jgi:hypothetical protein